MPLLGLSFSILVWLIVCLFYQKFNFKALKLRLERTFFWLKTEELNPSQHVKQSDQFIGSLKTQILALEYWSSGMLQGLKIWGGELYVGAKNLGGLPPPFQHA